jgi:hypothetical protein
LDFLGDPGRGIPNLRDDDPEFFDGYAKPPCPRPALKGIGQIDFVSEWGGFDAGHFLLSTGLMK